MLFKTQEIMRALAILAVVPLVLLLHGCQKQPAEKEKPLPVITVEEVRRSDAVFSLKSTGIVEPWEEARLSFQVPGKIQEGPAEEGAVVAAGQVLARLDDSGYRVQAESARYQLDQAEVELDRAKTDLDRCERLFAEGAVPRKTLDDARFAFRAAEARAGQAASALKKADLMLEHSVLTAPFSGTVIKKIGRRGEIVAEGNPVLVLARFDPAKVVLAVPANQTGNWEEGSEAWVSTDVVPAAARAGNGRKIKAVVHKVSPGAEGLTGSFRVELAVENRNGEIRPGQVVNVERLVKTGTGLWIPLKSVISRGQDLKYVFVIDPSGPVVRQRAVKLGPVAGDRVEVVAGLEPGSRIAVIMPEDLRDGDRVEVR